MSRSFAGSDFWRSAWAVGTAVVQFDKQTVERANDGGQHRRRLDRQLVGHSVDAQAKAGIKRCPTAYSPTPIAAPNTIFRIGVHSVAAFQGALPQTTPTVAPSSAQNKYARMPAGLPQL